MDSSGIGVLLLDIPLPPPPPPPPPLHYSCYTLSAVAVGGGMVAKTIAIDNLTHPSREAWNEIGNMQSLLWKYVGLPAPQPPRCASAVTGPSQMSSFCG